MSLNADAGRGLWERGIVHRNGFSCNQRSSVVLAADSRISITELTRAERSDLRRKLRRELERLRILSCKIEARESQIRSQSLSAGFNPSFSDAQFSGNDARSCPGKEVTSHRMSTPVGKSLPAFRDVGLARQNSYSVDGRSFVSDLSFKEKRTPKANQLYHSSEFLTGKDKMPVADKAKAKSCSGSKRGALSGFDSRDKKRPAVEQSNNRHFLELLRQCGNLLKRLMQHKHAWVFNEPVDTVKYGLLDYFTVIKRPMDLGTVRGKLSRNEYATPVHFAEDVRLTFLNAMTYNPPTNDVYAMADVLRKVFEEKWRIIEEKYEESRIEQEASDCQRPRFFPAPVPSFEKLQRDEVSDQSQVMPKKVIPDIEVPAVTKSKPKAQAKPKRGMSFQEKKKLSANMGLLPVDRLEEIVPLMKARNPNLVQKGDEIIVDVETFDNETLWELHRYVTGCLRNMSKVKKGTVTVPLVNQVAADVLLENVSKARKGDLGDEDVDIDDDLPDTSFPPVVIDKDGGYASRSSSSGSSSSDSGSSSDSDSGSSSGSDSDAEDAHSADRRH